MACGAAMASMQLKELDCLSSSYSSSTSHLLHSQLARPRPHHTSAICASVGGAVPVSYCQVELVLSVVRLPLAPLLPQCPPSWITQVQQTDDAAACDGCSIVRPSQHWQLFA